MRIGLLVFGEEDQGALPAWLTADENDVMAGEAVVTSDLGAVKEAERLARADGDGVLLCLGAGTNPRLIPQAALHTPCPILLVSETLPTLLAASGALEEIGIPFGRVWGRLNAPESREPIMAWLSENERRVRQRGEDAARKLYGRRCGHIASVTDGGVLPDTTRWMQQFGVTIHPIDPLSLLDRAREIPSERIAAAFEWLRAHEAVRQEVMVDEPSIRLYLAVKDRCAEEDLTLISLADRVDGLPTALVAALLGDPADGEGEKTPVPCAPYADAHGALTLALLHLASGVSAHSAAVQAVDNASRTLTVSPAAAFPEDAPVTVARITRRGERYRCVLFNSVSAGGALTLAFDPSRLLEALASPVLHAVPGNHRGAMRAACHALDIEAVVLS